MQPTDLNLGVLTDPQIFAVGRLPAVSDHDTFADTREAQRGQGSLRLALDGRWKFAYAQNTAERPDGFEQPTYDCSGWDEIEVPGHIQLQGYGKPQYVNTQYPWDGHENPIPPQIPQRNNPVGSYITRFSIPKAWAGSRITLIFHGVESAFFVWVNGEPVGYAEDSFTPSRFDITKTLVEGENKLAVQVFRYCSGSWLEDQDFWRFSGIFRGVELRAEPPAHVEDIFIRALPAQDLKTAELTAEISLTLPQEPVTLQAQLLNGEGREVDCFPVPAREHALLVRTVPHPRLWSAECPELYTLRLTLLNAQGREIEVAQTELGFRRFEIKNGVLQLNGKRLLLHGVNRHEFNTRTGRALSQQDMLWDIQTLKRNNINAVRTSHYPNNSLWYRLCDRYGIYLVDETNLETHGTWMFQGKVSSLRALPYDNEVWLPACLDRARSMLERDKNHPSVLVWSCGNESYGGSVIHAMSQFFRMRDSSRPVHYEGVFHDRRYNDTSDMESQMYTPATGVAAWLNEHTDKPFILCEYAHAMGNSVGGLSEYLALEDRYAHYQGAFIWDWIDQAIEAPLPSGRRGLCYGGDFYDQPTDRNFCGDGLVFADRTPTPKLQEVKFLYQNVRIIPDSTGVTLQNRFLFDDLRGYRLTWNLTLNGEPVAYGELENLTLSAGETEFFTLPLPPMDQPGEYALLCELRLKAECLWAPAGFTIIHGQAVLNHTPAVPATQPRAPETRVVQGDVNVGVNDDTFETLFGLTEGGPIAFGRMELLSLFNFAPRPSLYRAPLDNDVGNRFPQQTGLWRAFSLLAVPVVTGMELAGSAPTLCYRFSLPFLTNAALEVTYTALSANRLRVDAALIDDENLPDLPALGLSFRLPRELHIMRYYGLGPQENETDRHCGAVLGLYRTTAEENLTPYLKPQACGNRTGVRWAELSDGKGRTLRISMAENPLQVSVLTHSQEELASALHQEELPPIAYTYLDVAAARYGVGGDDSWGAPVLPAYRLKANDSLRLSFILEAL
jgi:beta-galactosidase